MKFSDIRHIAIYLPQFHPIPENDDAWGTGFTEWTNVKKAVPLFEGHYQPHIPHDSVGYYDLRDPEVLNKQAEMAKKYGIFGFAYYHYWFNGKRLLNTPIDNMLTTGSPDFPFLFIWANENWTKRWDGMDNEIIIKQDYSFEDDHEHIKFLCNNVFNDIRYITIDDKPVFIVYRTELFPDIKLTAQIWREEVKKYGYKDIYLIRVENFITGISPVDIGFDAAMEFAPNRHDWIFNKVLYSSNSRINVYDYNSTVLNLTRKKVAYKCYRTVFPSWDNSPRKKNEATIFNNIHPLAFEYFLHKTIEYTYKNFANDERMFFINAWNEWGEGCHIEPDKRNGFKFLEACRKSVKENYAGLSDVNSNIQLLEDVTSFLLEKNKQLQKDYNHLLESYKPHGFKVSKAWRFVRRFLRFIKR